MRDDDAATDQVLDEIEECSECLRCLVQFLASSTASAFISIAGENRPAAIFRAEELLADAVDQADHR
jgi:hypothetical protein